VIDQNLSVGSGGITVGEIAQALYAEAGRPLLLSYVGGLGGKDVSEEEFDRIVADLLMASSTGQTPPARLLFTDVEARNVRGLLEIAGKAAPR
jgi:pyruvate ferredoxin oxidoreductase alpha subunit